MDFLHRNANNQPQTTRATGSQPLQSAAVSHGGSSSHQTGFNQPKWLRIALLGLLFSITILTLSISVLLYFGKDKEARYVDTSKQQAVFLTNGQVYFGRLTNVNDDFVRLESIYYLNSQASDTAKATEQTSFSLVKLGCELHGPTDQMVINRNQISFWENLKGDGKVAKAIEQWVTQNPNGQDCSTTTNSTEQSPTGTTTAPKKQ